MRWLFTWYAKRLRKRLLLKMAESDDHREFTNKEIIDHYHALMIQCCNIETKAESAGLTLALSVLARIDPIEQEQES